MSLRNYLGKRKFDRTPEPKPGKLAAQPGNRFYVQRHEARRLHYDLRLEVDGVLRSWAVPKGPTLDPAEKRLAVEVEDHPLEYGSFEGTIPPGNYGAGNVKLWDRGTYEVLGDVSVQEQLDRGDFKFALHGTKLVGNFALVRLKGQPKQWLLLKKPDFAAQPGWDAEHHPASVLGRLPNLESIPNARRAPMLSSLAPMLATPSNSLPEGSEWLYEIKWDGFRALCFVDHGAMRLVSRTGHNMDEQFPELTMLASNIAAKTAILDCEVVCFDSAGRPSFERLQQRTGKATSISQRSYPVSLVAFDLLYCNGYDIRKSPLIERKQLLQALITPSPVLRVSEHFTGPGQQLLAAVREQQLEGVLAKVATSPYESGRSTCWLKVKLVTQQEFVISGLMLGDRSPFSSLLLGYYENSKLRYAGNVGTGFDEAKLHELHELLTPLQTKTAPLHDVPKLSGEIVWLKPQVVCSVRFTSWTSQGRLRAPVFVCLRNDIEPRDCVREAVPSESTPPFAPKVLLPAGPAETFVDIDGQRLKFTNLNKIFFPDDGYTKRDLINYYAAVASLILPHLKDRPLSLKRYPQGITGKYFFQKDTPQTYPSWLRTERISTPPNDKPTRFIFADNAASLLYLANLGCIDQNPWFSRIGSLDNPDFILLDLDPYHCGFDRIVEAALLASDVLDQVGLTGYPKTTGGDGLHIYVPLEPVYSFEQARTFAEIIARLCFSRRPDLFTTPRAVAQREKGKVYFDYPQLAWGKTISAPYVVRPHPGAPVATPLAWSELTSDLTPVRFHLRNVLDRFSRVGDLFAPVLTKKQRLETAIERIEKLAAHR